MARNVMVGKSVATSSAPFIVHVPPQNGSVLSIEEWANQIRTIWARGATTTLELARLVCRARRSLRYGAWGRMWSSRPMPFSKRKADKLVSIGRHLGDLDENNCAHLPTRWSILYCLSFLGAATVERCIKEGIIHPGLTLREAKELLQNHRGRRDGEKPKRPSVGLRLRKFEEFVDATFKEWSSADQRCAQEKLTAILRRIESARGIALEAVPRLVPPARVWENSSSNLRAAGARGARFASGG